MLAGAQQELSRTRNGAGEPVKPSTAAGARLLGGESIDVGRMLDLLTAVPGAGVCGDDLEAVEHAHGLEGGADGECALSTVVRDGVVVEIKAGVGRLSDLDLDELVAREGLVGQRDKPCSFLGEDVADAASGVFGPRAIGANTGHPVL